MKFDIVRSWKDQTYRENLSEEQRGCLPANPAGDLELSEADLASVYGGNCPHGSGYYRRNGWGENGHVERNANICSHSCNVDILAILDLDLL